MVEDQRVNPHHRYSVTSTADAAGRHESQPSCCAAAGAGIDPVLRSPGLACHRNAVTTSHLPHGEPGRRYLTGLLAMVREGLAAASSQLLLPGF
jgi:hypothetical protein